MFVGHYGPSFAIKALRPAIPLWLLFIAVQLVDVAFGTEETIQLLLDAGAIIDARDMNGDSPLTWAGTCARRDSPATVLRRLCHSRGLRGRHAGQSARDAACLRGQGE
jgi:ankyrin repeat protein